MKELGELAMFHPSLEQIFCVSGFGILYFPVKILGEIYNLHLS